MHCYYHDDAADVAVGRSCGKGLCHACGVDVDRGVACAGCEEDARQLIAYLQSHIKLRAAGAKIIGRSRATAITQGSFIILVGIGIAAMMYHPDSGFNARTALGALSVLYGLFLIRAGWSIPKLDQQSPSRDRSVQESNDT
jgi:hypothetical protein